MKLTNLTLYNLNNGASFFFKSIEEKYILGINARTGLRINKGRLKDIAQAYSEMRQAIIDKCNPEITVASGGKASFKIPPEFVTMFNAQMQELDNVEIEVEIQKCNRSEFFEVENNLSPALMEALEPMFSEEYMKE